IERTLHDAPARRLERFVFGLERLEDAQLGRLQELAAQVLGQRALRKKACKCQRSAAGSQSSRPFVSGRGPLAPSASCVRADRCYCWPMVVGRSRVLGLERAFAPGAIACLVLGAGACSAPGPAQTPTDTIETGGVGGAGSSFAPSTGGALPIGPIIVGPEPVGGISCSGPAQTGTTVFGPQAFDYKRIARRELFTWTTDEQAAELRRDQVLFTRSERPGIGPGYAFQIIEQMAQNQSSSERAMLASLLGGELFAKARFAWSEPWATRMGWPGEEYGRNLLRIVLKPEAWVAVIRQGNLTVYDQGGQYVPLVDALAAPTRLGMIFYEKDAFVGGPNCGGSFVSGGN